ncbi:MAG: hypothetical protein ACT4TC_20485, partial [Myxococcaceae bacterium]
MSRATARGGPAPAMSPASLERLRIFQCVAYLFAITAGGIAHADPIPGPFQNQSKAEARSLDCERLSHAEAHQRFPGEVPDLPARRLVGTADALACRQRIMREGERAARDEAILSTLSTTVAELTQAAK